MDYLGILNERQRQAVCHEGSPLLILAGAGSGKTRVITTKIAWLISCRNTAPESVLAVTFTNKAANEMKERACKLEPSAERAMIRTFHSFGAWILRRHAEKAGLSPNFTIYDDTDAAALLAQAEPSLTNSEARLFIKKIAKAKDLCLFPDDSGIFLIDEDPKFKRIYTSYQKRLKETGNADFGDLILLPLKILRENDTLRRNLQGRFSVIMVDEYQDSNIAQFEFLKILAGKNTYLCVVGDDDQSIYRFRGAEVRNILTFADSFAGTEIVRLEQNYRSKETVLKVADSIIRHNSGRLGKELIAERRGGEKPQVFVLDNQDIEAEFCAALIKEAFKSGIPLSDWAILYRTNAQSLGFETVFLREKIPYTVVGSLKFYEREEIKDTISVLSLIMNGKDEIALRRVINKPPRGIGKVTENKLIDTARTAMFGQVEGGFELATEDDFITAFSGLLKTQKLNKKAESGVCGFVGMIKKLREIIKTGGEDKAAGKGGAEARANEAERRGIKKGEGLAAFIYEVLEHSGLYEYHENQDKITDTQKIANLNELANVASLYEFSTDGLLNFLEHIELDRSLQENTESKNNSVKLITVHNTKGLEFRQVIITGLENGIFPRDESNAEELEEERRLMYVACTRAMDNLYMTSCKMRRMFGSSSFMRPSIFLSEINADLIQSFETENGRIIPARLDGFYSNANSYGIKNYQGGTGKWQRGEKIYHDDYGYGAIIKSDNVNGEIVISVQFETGLIKKFMPEYQAASLTVIKD